MGAVCVSLDTLENNVTRVSLFCFFLIPSSCLNVLFFSVMHYLIGSTFKSSSSKVESDAN